MIAPRFFMMTASTPILCDLCAGKKRGLRQVSLGKEDEIALKPFAETLRVIKPAQESPTSTWKRVLRGGGATHPAKRGQPALRPGHGASKVSNVGAFAVPLAGAVLPHRHGKGGVQSCRSRR